MRFTAGKLDVRLESRYAKKIMGEPVADGADVPVAVYVCEQTPTGKKEIELVSEEGITISCAESVMHLTKERILFETPQLTFSGENAARQEELMRSYGVAESAIKRAMIERGKVYVISEDGRKLSAGSHSN